MSREEKSNCNNCIYHHPLRVNLKAAEGTKISGECDHPKVPTRLTVSYGMLCNGKLHEFKTKQP